MAHVQNYYEPLCHKQKEEEFQELSYKIHPHGHWMDDELSIGEIKFPGIIRYYHSFGHEHLLAKQQKQ